LLASAGIPENKSGKAIAFKLIAKTGKVITAPLPNKAKTKMKQRLYTAAGSSDYLNAGRMRQVFSKVITEDARDYAKDIKAKTLLIYGTKDAITPVEYGHVFDDLISDSKLVVLEGLGHLAHKKAPDQVAKIMKEFL
jgi:pimeloyl-ACP methyl ester carboxylesterase